MKRYLILSDGTVYEGNALGHDAPVTGELVFTTGMCGYIETMTDPSYYGQIVMQTFPTIGNYGIIESDFEGKPALFGYVVREACEHPSNFRCEYTLDEFLKKNKIPGISGVDTRDITRRLRDFGVMNAMISDTPDADLDNIAKYSVNTAGARSAVMSVTSDAPVEIPACGEEKFLVVLYDFGEKRNIARSLAKRGCRVITVPANTKAATALSYNPDGIMLSNGPGDPSDNEEIIAELRCLMGKVPMFGICLGHQLLALAAGGRTVKLKYGHRGVNQPVYDLLTGRTYITSQNHGYAVVGDSVKLGRQRYINANDKTSEGIDYDEISSFSVQFHPEACSGPLDTGFLFDRFCDNMVTSDLTHREA